MLAGKSLSDFVLSVIEQPGYTECILSPCHKFKGWVILEPKALIDQRTDLTGFQDL